MSKCSMLYFVYSIVVIGLIQQSMANNETDNIDCDIVKDVNRTKRSLDDFFNQTTSFFFGDRESPELIRNFDVVKLRNLPYAKRVFKCVAKVGPCDDVGERMKGT